jgi:formylglycine-generating enzyme required for sulfatase activity
MCVVYGRYNDPPTTRKNLMGFRIVVLPSAAAGAAAPRAGAVTDVAPVERPGPQSPSVQSAKSPWDDAYVATAATGEKIPHPLSRKTYKQTLADGTTIEVPEGMVYVPAGEFTMGEKESEHKVYLDAYFIGKYEVTNAEWKVFRDVTSSVPPPKSWEGGQIPVGKENHPVVFVCWGWIQEYCEWVTRLRQGFGGQGAGTTWELRLPTEAQWERAARGPKGYVYPWGSEWNPKCCNWRGMWAAKYGLEFNITEGVPLNQWMAFAKSEKYGQETRSGLTMPVGSFPNGKSFYGCYDMAGNASEFCGDWFRRDYYGLKDAGRNPQGPSEEDAEECDLSGKKGKARVVRGGFWSGNSMDCRSVERSRSFPASSNTTNGFRVVVVGTR